MAVEALQQAAPKQAYFRKKTAPGHGGRGLVFEALPRLRVGGARRDRTDDPLLAKQVLSQLSYGPNNQVATSSVSSARLMVGVMRQCGFSVKPFFVLKWHKSQMVPHRKKSRSGHPASAPWHFVNLTGNGVRHLAAHQARQ